MSTRATLTDNYQVLFAFTLSCFVTSSQCSGVEVSVFYNLNCIIFWPKKVMLNDKPTKYLEKLQRFRHGFYHNIFSALVHPMTGEYV